MKSNSKPSELKVTNRFNLIMLMLLVLVFTMSCKDDDNGPDTRPLFVGSYEVEDISGASGYTYNYDITIANASHGLEISNFADILNVPVKATVDGNKLIIKSQSFTNPSSGNTIEVFGEGTIDGDVLTFTYATTGYIEYSGTCTATKK